MTKSAAIQESRWTGFGNGLQLGCEKERVISRGKSPVSNMHNGMDYGTIPKARDIGDVCMQVCVCVGGGVVSKP